MASWSYIGGVRTLRIALFASLGVAALGFLGVAAWVVILAAMFPAGNPALTTPPPLLSLAAGAFVVGSVTAVVVSAILRSRQLATHAHPGSPSAGAANNAIAGGLHTGDASSLVAEFRPTAIGISGGFIPTSSSFPGAQRLRIYPDGLDVRNLFGRRWVERQRIVGLYRLPGGFRVIWDDGDTRCSATISAWSGMKWITAALEQTGYRFDTGRAVAQSRKATDALRDWDEGRR